jgi:hypothetical protein
MKQVVHIAALPQAKEQRCLRCYAILKKFSSPEDRKLNALIPSVFVVAPQMQMQSHDAEGSFQVPCRIVKPKHLPSRGAARRSRTFQ